VTLYFIDLSLRNGPVNKFTKKPTCLPEVSVTTEAPQEIIDLFIEEFALGKVIAQSKGHPSGTICYEGGIITYEAQV
jgi:hypothetical protein